jgi:predicted CopG family antitoxin
VEFDSIDMSSKKVSLREDVYRELKAAKGEDESFSDVVERLLATDRDEHPLDRLEGLLDKDEAENVRERMRDFRSSLDDDMDRYA